MKSFISSLPAIEYARKLDFILNRGASMLGTEPSPALPHFLVEAHWAK